MNATRTERTVGMALMLGLCFAVMAGAAERAPVKVIIDADPGVDDSMAILLALASPAIEVVGITTVFGNTAIDNATAIRIRGVAFTPSSPQP